MKEEILSKLEQLLESDDFQSVKKEFKELSAQYKTLMTELVSPTDKSQEQSDQAEQNSSTEAESNASNADNTSAEKSVDTESIEGLSGNDNEMSQDESESVTSENTPDNGEQQEEPSDSTIDVDPLDERFKVLMEKFRDQVKKANEAKEKIEKETIAKANALLEDLKQIISNEENIGKAFAGFNTIKDTWKDLPKVSNDAYRDLNAEYNKYVEQFFYNINIYKELKDLDLKHNLEEKKQVLEDQKKLLDVNDIRLLEVEVRLNQDKWNEIGPTFKEDWDKIKDEFWNVTRAIYKRIQDFYGQRRDEQQKNLEKKNELLNRAKYLASLELKAHKKWKEKTQEIIELQNQWKMIGFVPKEEASAIWNEFRTVCDSFFDKKRAHYEELHSAQDANRDLKLKLVEEAESLKDNDDWNTTASKLTKLQREWKSIGPAHQRDENKLWRRFREACDHFFKAKKGFREEEVGDQLKNKEAKEKLLEEIKAFEVSDNRTASLEKLKEFSDKWRKIGHVPFKAKDALNKAYKAELDKKYSALKIDRKQKEQIKFEQRLADIKEGAQGGKVLKKEQDAIRAKITKLKGEINQFENNMGFFASSSGAEKLKHDIEKKIDLAKEEIETLKDRLVQLRNAND